ncbi:MAG: outer membrane protein assembly factor BamB family protein [Planctomycetota bacterium]|jgi:outer membrane protein assembly factor BamB
MATNRGSQKLAVADLVFVAFNSRAAALNRKNGRIVWRWKSPKGSGFVALLLDGERLIASVNGYTYCLDPLTGEQLWTNQMSGFGLGVPCLTSFRGSSLGASVLAQTAADQAAANAATQSAGG